MPWVVNTDQGALEASVSRQLGTWLAGKAQPIATTASTLAPKGKSGSLAADIIWRVEGTGYNQYAVITARSPYAYFVHEGTKPHPIVPVNARVLRFEAGGDVLFRPRVSHPGTRAQPFLRDAAAQVLGGT